MKKKATLTLLIACIFFSLGQRNDRLIRLADQEDYYEQKNYNEGYFLSRERKFIIKL
ncbi:MAG: hypothetical protein Q4E36_01280 [Bacillota bacterium]|nr:hypothetical protein [Bacillota bacterium]